MAQEIVAAFARAGLPLRGALADMLDEHFSHHTERRGCGYTQATRYLAPLINTPRDPLAGTDLELFADWPRAETERLAARAMAAGWAQGWRCLDLPGAPLASLDDGPLLAELRTLRPRVDAVRATLVFEESLLFVDLLRDLLGGSERPAPVLPVMREKPAIGSCSQAEEYFLEIAQRRIRRGGAVNTVVDDDGRPLLLEKVGLGESHSALVVEPLRLGEVWIPPGALCALRYVDPLPPARRTRNGSCFSFRALAEVRFLRLTTLAVAPQARKRAFGPQLRAQLQANMLSPLTCTMEQLRCFAEEQLQ
ncbi:MAG: hypothetical protein BGP24_16505 [Lysobacterales bacterium 69-70]|nr:hypothetical protein [Xanthomonadaceae bacterium]ODU33630.1 MAG: hypothetical protein ABS97_11620 [Xanthomonadaceae bacterium SCN 69-320]ODV21925.1 MAG: hypothetical protein ABT27_03250 [Xanthomonadaceae bacterium SCN 69-25]OJZ02828.1 MAG: hypothetical protein BGP24_16505 [Xanthomonadales bacterium 69-70]